MDALELPPDTGAKPLKPLIAVVRSLTESTRFIEVFLEDNKLYYRPVDSQETEGVLLYEN